MTAPCLSRSKISIVTPSFNQACFIEEALQSVKEQSYPAAEHLVIDGGSSDGTVEILKRYSSQPGWEHLHWISERDRGQSDALNKGFRTATGDIVGWLNSDDRYRSGCFQTIVDGFQKHDEADVIYGDYTWVDEKGKITQVRREISFSRFILLYHRVLYIPSTATFFNRRIFEKGEFINTDLHYSMDYEFFVRLAQHGYRFKHVSGLLADFRWHSSSKTVTNAAAQSKEVDEVVRQYSRPLRRCPTRATQTLGLRVLRAAAAGARYFEKLLRGYYFGQWIPSRRLAPERGRN